MSLDEKGTPNEKINSDSKNFSDEPTETLPSRGGHFERKQIGPYTLLEELGEGGMGVVYLAEQRQPVQRRVALKLIKWGMDTKQVVARFESERQALAMMNHANIARVFDAGATQDGRPYFVMEYVGGLPITEYCDIHRLKTEERLKLFTQVCDGIQHAHQKGIIHRDIKPSNVLVAIQDGKAVPKIIDFGVAKATSRQLTAKTVFTEHGQLIGTPEYMSPEQAEGTILDIDTRTDIYSLGVLLYELMVGTLPFDPKELRLGGLIEIQRRIREMDPPKPSTRITTLTGEDAQKIAKNRRVGLQQLTHVLRGDMDAIIMKTLEKDRARRYSTPVELAADVNRFLKHEPVQAQPPGTIYLLGKFIRRNRGAVIATASIFLVLILGILGTTLGLLRAELAREEAELNRLMAEKEAENAKALSGFLQTTLSSADPAAAGKDVRVVEILDTAAERIDLEFSDKPEIQAAIRTALARSYQGLGLFQEAEKQFDQAFSHCQEKLGPNHPETVRLIAEKALLCQHQGRLEDSEILFHQALESQIGLIGKGHPDTLSTANNLANLLVERSKLGEAEELFLSLLPEDAYRQDSFVKERFILQNNFAFLLQRQGRFTEAEKNYRESLHGLAELLGEEHPDTVSAMANLGTLLQEMDRMEESEALAVKALQIRRNRLGSEHPWTVLSINNLASILQARGKLDEAAPLYREALDLNSRILGKNHPDTLVSMNNLAFFLEEVGQLEEAEKMYREVLQKSLETLGDRHQDTLISMNNLSALLQETGQLKAALELINRALATARQVLPNPHYLTGIFAGRSGHILLQMNQFSRSEGLLLESYNTLCETLGEEHNRSIEAGSRLAELYSAWNKPDVADRYRY